MPISIVPRHQDLVGLTTGDDHTQYALLAGRSGGQSLTGGTGSGETLTLNSTSHGTKGKVLLGADSAYDHQNIRLGIGTTSPSVGLHIVRNPLSANFSQIHIEPVSPSSEAAVSLRTTYSTGRSWFVGCGTGGAGDSMKFRLFDLTAGADRINVDTSGRVIINSSQSGTATLDLYSTAAATPVTRIRGATSQSARLMELWQVSSVQAREAGAIDAVWVDNTDASRKARVVFSAFDTAEREFMRGEADGSNPMIGFLGSAATAKETVSGSRGGNAALADLLTKLATKGLITDGSSA